MIGMKPFISYPFNFGKELKSTSALCQQHLLRVSNTLRQAVISGEKRVQNISVNDRKQTTIIRTFILYIGYINAFAH